MGWERKRGAVIELCRFLHGEESELTVSGGDGGELVGIPYVLTLDEDTVLHTGSVSELLGFALHPCNRPFTDESGRVRHGHAVIVPCINTSLTSGEKTLFSHLVSMPGGIDPYTGTSFDLYADVFGAGSFCGKGLIEVASFCGIIPDFFPDGTVLSHDLMEGNLLHSALASCLALTDSIPETPASYYAREERWIRGDVQALRFAGKTVRTKTGKKENPMTGLGRYKIIDNVLRESAPLFSVLLLLTAGMQSGLCAVLLTLTALLPLLYAPLDGFLFSLAEWSKKRISFSSFLRIQRQAPGRFFFDFFSLGCRACLFAAAFFRTLYRMTVSHRHLLSWQTASQKAGEKSGFQRTLFLFAPGAALGLFALLFLSFLPLRLLLGLWIFYPFFAVLAEKPRKEAVRYSEKEKERLRGYAEDIWRFFDGRVGEDTHYLPPDNEQFQPVHRIAARTSPTNIGLYLLSLLAARDFGWIDSETLHERAQKTGGTLLLMQKWKGHLFNWYDTETAQVIGEPFISSVDSGNFVTALTAFCEGLKEYAGACPPLLDDIALYESLIEKTDFSALFSEKRNCISVGYHLREERLDDACYDTYMSEFRTTAFYLTALGILSPASFFSLNRQKAGTLRREGFLSWGGTAFEFFMPSLLLPTTRESAVRYALKQAAAFQAEQKKTVQNGAGFFGISESGYFAFDAEMNYQYRAFGIGALALDPIRKTEPVFAPYAAFLMLSTDKRAYDSLKAFEKAGMKGRYGFYEAIDCDKRRVGEGYAIIKSVMAHHLGMSMTACANVCFDGIFQKRFMRRPVMRASAELLCEKQGSLFGRAPNRIRFEAEPAGKAFVSLTAAEEKTEYNTLFPAFAMLSNEKCRVICSSLGHIKWMSGKDCLCFSDFDPETLGSSLRVLFAADGAVYSAVPSGGLQTGGSFSFEKGEERITFCGQYEKEGGTLLAIQSISLSPDEEIMRVTAELKGDFREASATLWCEPILESEESYRAHKCFSYLSLESRYDADEKVLVCKRRPKKSGKEFCCFGISEENKGITDFDTARENCLSAGYGDREIVSLALAPANEKTGQTGAVLYPGFRVRSAFIPGKKTSASFLLGASDDEDELFYMLSHAKKRSGPVRAQRNLHAFLAEGRREIPLLEQYLLGALLLPGQSKSALSQAAVYARRHDPFYQNDFWRLGLSGEEPLVAAYISSLGRESAEHLKLLLLLFRYATVRGLRYEFLILYGAGEEPDAENKMREMIDAAGLSSFIGGRNGIFVLGEAALSEKEKEMIFSYSSLTFDCKLDPLISAKAGRRFLDIGRCRVFPPVAQTPFPCRLPSPPDPTEETGGGTFYKSGFRFEKGNKKAVWAHVLSGEGLGTVVSENSLGFTFFTNAAERKLTPHTADGMTEDKGERLLLEIRREGEEKSRFYDLISCAGTVDYRFDSAVWSGTAESLFSYTVAVSVGERIPSKEVSVRIKNESAVPLSYRLSYVVKPDLGVPPCFLHYEIQKNVLRVVPLADFGAGGLRLSLFSDSEAASFLTDYTEFRSGGALSLERTDCAVCRTEGKTEKSAVHRFYLSANGDFTPEDEIKREKSRNCVRLKTDDPLFDFTVNALFPYQTKASRLQARSGFYQVGGAYGFRDQLQDTLSLLDREPERARVQILRACAHQFEEGDVTHWWHAVRDFCPDDFGIRTRISDDLLWLPFTACLYADVTGKDDLWNTQIRFLTAPALRPGERDRCAYFRKSERRDSVYGHCVLAAEYALTRIGAHGLPLFGTGDWNDGMNEVGAGGKGESVWLGQFLISVLSLLIPVCEKRGDTERSGRFAKAAAALSDSVRKQFCEDRYIRGFFDDGTPFGRAGDAFCETDVLPQAFAAFCFPLSGGEEERKRAKKAMKTALCALWHEKYRLFCLLAPPFDFKGENPGYIRGYVPGVRENGAQYTHAAVWACMALLELGENKNAFRLLCDLNPALRCREARIRECYRTEPYVMAGDVTIASPFTGRGGWSWYTGAAGWYRTAVLSYLCGYRRHGAYFTLSPHLSSLFDNFSLTVCDEKTCFSVSVSAGETPDCFFDGKRLPVADPKNARFYFDGKEHRIEMICQSEEGD